jgi:purine-binding chemotaxis protein CheW
MAVKEMDYLDEDTMHGRYITFRVDEQMYGIQIRYVTEIIGIQPVSQLPEMPDYIKGIINLRGKIIPVVDMRLKFKRPAVEYTEKTCILVIDNQNISAGLIVDEVADVLAIEDENISPAPNYGSVNCRYLEGIGKVGKEVKLLLDCEALFSNEEADQLHHITEEGE